MVPLCPAAIDVVRPLVAASPGPWLFWAPATRGRQTGHYTVQRIWQAVQRAKKAAGIAKGTTHTFRHAFCSFMANSGVPPLMVMKIMGHASLDIVLIYYHVRDEQLLSALAGLNFENMFGGVAKPAA